MNAISNKKIILCDDRRYIDENTKKNLSQTPERKEVLVRRSETVDQANIILISNRAIGQGPDFQDLCDFILQFNQRCSDVFDKVLIKEYFEIVLILRGVCKCLCNMLRPSLINRLEKYWFSASIPDFSKSNSSSRQESNKIQEKSQLIESKENAA